MAKIQEGFFPFRGYRTYYRIVGESDPGKLPLLALHGGPGCGHDYLESLDAIADKYHRQVIYYDQCGCGKSRIPDGNADFYTYESYMDELDTLRKELGLEKVHLLGQSWGGMLEMLYVTKRPYSWVQSMVVASSPASAAIWLKEANRLRSYLPQDMQDALIKADEDGNYDDPEVARASAEYYRRHVCKLDPYPDFVARSFDQMGEDYMVMQGASEFVITGKMKDYDVTEGLKGVKLPTLVTSGQLDEATPLIAKQVTDLIPGARWVMFEGGTHLCHVEYPELFNETIELFMEEHDKV
ncbi:MAG: proline iminopeptidase-family hydrolase [Butyrivibrio sp.]|nr:proline iminopeptidase-family hydrolase [Butyrivibrio sp.]